MYISLLLAKDLTVEKTFGFFLNNTFISSEKEEDLTSNKNIKIIR